MIALVDYGGGNLRSVEMALSSVGADVRLTSDISVIERAEGVVSPGQGNFGDVVGSLRQQGLEEVVRKRALEAMQGGRPFLGICVGMQYLVEESEESPGVPGLGLFRGRCRRLRPDDPSLKVPHMGWNTLEYCPGPGEKFLRGLPESSYVYFVHSYYVELDDPADRATETNYGIRFCSALARGHLFATQFHLEKSQKAGLRILRNFVDLAEAAQ